MGLLASGLRNEAAFHLPGGPGRQEAQVDKEDDLGLASGPRPLQRKSNFWGVQLAVEIMLFFEVNASWMPAAVASAMSVAAAVACRPRAVRSSWDRSLSGEKNSFTSKKTSGST